MNESYFFGNRNLRLTCPFIQGIDVKILQILVNMLPENIVRKKLTVDGVFNSLTRNAVRDFQSYFNLTADGVVGQETYFRLGHRTGKYAVNETVFSSRVLKNGLQGSDVEILQNRLSAFRKPYLNTASNGKYTFFTETAVKLFQEDFPELLADGIVDQATYEKLFTWAPIGGRTLRLATNGLDTYWLQLYLFQLGYYNGPLHGFFDYDTDKAVWNFQDDAGITVDGIVGTETYLAIGTSTAFPQVKYLYRVQPEDSIFTISQLFNKSMQDIVNLNNISPPDFTIYVGQLLQIPVPLTFHLTEKGDNLDSIASRYSIPVSYVKNANSLLPDSSLIPGETIVLPGFFDQINGSIIYLNKATTDYELIQLNINSMEKTLLAILSYLSSEKLFLNQEKTVISLIGLEEKEIINYSLQTGRPEFLPLANPVDYLDWSFDNQVIVVSNTVTGNSVIIDVNTGIHLFEFYGKTPQWMDIGNKLVYYRDQMVETLDFESGIIEELLKVEDLSIWYLQYSSTNEKVLFFGFVPPGRVTLTFLYDLQSGSLQEISSNDYFGEWSRTQKVLLLNKREFYGDFLPWFYQNVRSYTADGEFISNEIYAKNIELNIDNFSVDDSHFTLVLSNPNTFYPVAAGFRDIFVKKLNTGLITQITQGENTFSPVWL